MAYPIKMSATVPKGQTVTFSFRPTAAGLVNVVVNSTSSGPPPHETGEPGNPNPVFITIQVELLKPGATAPEFSKTGSQDLMAPGARDLVIVWGDSMATAADLSADWVVRVTNAGDLETACGVTVRYQVMDGNLGKVDHIVVLMMENRSFDHMLGYLHLEQGRADVDGLSPGEFNQDLQGNKYPIHPLSSPLFRTDPRHDWNEVDKQLDGGNAGFVRNFAEELEALPPGQEPVESIMGYHNATFLKVYDKLASEFAICDRWFASLPTDTWPNRLYSLTGGSGGAIDTPSTDEVSKSPPGYSLKTIFEHLQEHGVDWGIFFSDLPFPLIFTRLVQDANYTARMRLLADFIARAETGDLPAVSWLDPNFTDVEVGALASFDTANDDHPPGDVIRGQRLVGQIYTALSQSPAWSKTLLLITYDEHGGFYDHVRPPGTPPPGLPPGQPPAADGPPDDDLNFRRYGVRVPAFVISPWTERGSVSKETYDHTSLLATILRRFCVSPELPRTNGVVMRSLHGRVPSMGARADAARDVGSVLSAQSPRTAVAEAPVVARPEGPPPALAPQAFGAVLRKAVFGF